MMILNETGRMTGVNQACCDLLQSSRGQLLTSHIQDVLHPEDVGAFHVKLAEIAGGVKPSFQLDQRLLRKDQEWVCAKVTGIGICHPSGDSLQIFCIVEDRVENDGINPWLDLQRTALEMLAEGSSQADFLNTLCVHIERLVPGAACCILLVDSPVGIRHVHAGPNVAPDVQKALEDMALKAGAGVGDRPMSVWRMVTVEDTATSPYWEQRRELAGQLGIAVCWSIPILSKGGTVLGYVILAHSRPYVPTAAHLKVVETTSFLLSIAIQRHSEEQRLRESQDRFEVAVRGSSDGLWDAHALRDEPWNSPRTPVWYAPRFKEMLGYTDEEFPNVLESFASHLHPDDKAFVFEKLEAHVLHGEPYDVEYRLRTKSGHFKWFSGRGQAVWDDAGNPLRMSGSIRDISLHKQAEQELADREQRLRQALEERTRISQDLHDHVLQSLYAVGLLISAIKKPAKESDALQVLHYVDQGIAQLDQAMVEIRQFIAGFGAGKSVCEDFVSGMHSLANSLLDVGGPTFEVDAHEVAVRVMTAEHKAHLLSVAREAMHNCLQHAQATHGRLSLVYDHDRQVIRLEILDNGKGFDSSYAQDGGHGLVNMRARANQIGGRLRIASSPGNGTRVSLEIPQGSPG